MGKNNIISFEKAKREKKDDKLLFDHDLTVEIKLFKRGMKDYAICRRFYSDEMAFQFLGNGRLLAEEFFRIGSEFHEFLVKELLQKSLKELK